MMFGRALSSPGKNSWSFCDGGEKIKIKNKKKIIIIIIEIIIMIILIKKNNDK